MTRERHGVRLSELLGGAGVRPHVPSGVDPLVAGATLDSRRVRPGDLFCAIRGFRVNGEGFVDEAVRRGARAVLAESAPPPDLSPDIAWVRVDHAREATARVARELNGRPDERLTLVGVTGTNGKTTVTCLLEAIARAAGKSCGRIGTIGYAIDGRSFVSERTTPEAPDLYRLLARMADGDVQIVAMEVSSHALALGRVEGARFAAASFLNLTEDHLDFHRDMESYFEAKARLFDALSAERIAVLPRDSEPGRRLAARTRARVLTFGRAEGADVRLTEERSGLEGSSAILETPVGRIPVRSFLVGRVHLENVAAAAACALAIELPVEAIAEGVLALETIEGRMERVGGADDPSVFVDYAHTPAALQTLLDWLRDVSQGRLTVVFGCGGGRDRSKRARMGRIAAERADRVVLTSDNPRDENPERILDEIERGVRAVTGGGERTVRCADREQAIRLALGEAESGDVVVIAGKGHETSQEIGGETRPFDDTEVARAALRERTSRGGRGARA